MLPCNDGVSDLRNVYDQSAGRLWVLISFYTL